MAKEGIKSFEELAKLYGSGEKKEPERRNNNPPPKTQNNDRNQTSSSIVERPQLLTPADTADKVKTSGSVEHFGLKISKYLIRDPQKPDQKLAEYNFKEWVAPNFELTEKIRKQLLTDQKSGAEEITERGKLFEKELITTWRLALGLGSESVLETSMTLHHTYGFPYIPGQALKGVVRSYAVNMFFGDEKTALKNVDFCMIFGGGDGAVDEKAGDIIFFDVIPTAKPEVIKDIMNPHFEPYYSAKDNKPPGDYYDPVPIPFRTVKNTPFRFMAGLKRGKSGALKTEVFSSGNAVDVVGDWIEKSLSIFGIGAKTAVGYGRFE